MRTIWSLLPFVKLKLSLLPFVLAFSFSRAACSSFITNCNLNTIYFPNNKTQLSVPTSFPNIFCFRWKTLRFVIAFFSEGEIYCSFTVLKNQFFDEANLFAFVRNSRVFGPFDALFISLLISSAVDFYLTYVCKVMSGF